MYDYVESERNICVIIIFVPPSLLLLYYLVKHLEILRRLKINVIIITIIITMIKIVMLCTSAYRICNHSSTTMDSRILVLLRNFLIIISHTQICCNTHTHTHTHTHTCMHTRTYAHTHTNTHIHLQSPS